MSTTKIGVLGTGMVGKTVGGKLVELGHDVLMGSRTADNAAAAEWVESTGDGASQGTFTDAAEHGELLFNCVKGEHALSALEMAGTDNLRGKLLLDLSNPLDFSNGFPPSLTVCNTDSMGEQIQRAYPDTKVVKTLNTMSCDIMIAPDRLPEPTAVFVSGNDADAKQRVTRILTEWFGWPEVVDLGDITTARGTEQFLPLWVRLYGTLGTGHFNIRLVRQDQEG